MSQLGRVIAVTQHHTGAIVTGDHAAQVTTLTLDSCIDLDEDGGELLLPEGMTVQYGPVDRYGTTIALVAPLPAALEDGAKLRSVPEEVHTSAAVIIDGEPGQQALDVDVPTDVAGWSNLAEDALVEFEDRSGRLVAIDVLGGEPRVDATIVDNADQLLLASRMATLRQVLDDSEAAMESARTNLEQVQAELSRAFGQIDLLPDEGYVNAAKQQAIAAAELDAKTKADAAEARAKALAATKIRAYVSPTTPTAPAGGFTEGDLWVDSDDGNKLSRWSGTAWVSIRDTGIAAGSTEAAAALSKATEALSKAEAAQSTADGAIRTHYSATPPWPDASTRPQADLGDMWFDTDDGQAYRWNGTAWQVIKDQSISQALAAAQTAQTTADGKITAFYQAAAPTTADDGDLWYDTDDKNKPYFRSGTQWVSIADTRIADQAALLSTVQGDLTGLSGRVDGKAVVYVQTTAPTGLTAQEQGDIWIDTSSGRVVKVWNGSMWVEADSRVAKAVVDITTKTTTYQTTSSGQTPAAPAGGFTVGDLWVDRFAGDKISRWTGTAWAALDIASTAYVAAKGTDLVVNGTGYLKSNYNFSWATFDSTIAPVGTNGAFIAPAVQTTRFTDELLPYDPTKAYLVGFKAWQLVTGSQDRLYAGLAPFDAFGQLISTSHYMHIAGTQTTLAKALNPGDTTITLTSAAGWYGQAGKAAGSATHQRSIIWWDYTDPGGKLWPAGSYSRYHSGGNYWADGGIVGNVITLAAPYSGPARPVGTKLSNGTAGGNYMYFPAVQNAIVPQTPTTYSEVLKAGTMDPALQAVATAGAATWLTGPPQMTASLKIVWLTNYPPAPAGPPRGQMAFAAVTMSDAAAAQAKADATAATLTTVQSDLTGLSGRVDGKAVVYVQALAPGGLTAADQGDIWIDTSSGTRVTKVWSGTAWVDADTRTAKAVSDITTKTTTFHTTGTTAPPTPSGGFTVGDLWIDSNGKIARWSTLGWVAVVDPQALANAAETRAKAYTTTMTDGLAKGVESTALPGTTVMPKDSVWRRLDANGKYMAVFVQTASPQGSNWVPRTFRNEVFDTIDAGKVTVSGDTVLNEALVKKLAADIASFIKVDAGSLTVTGDTVLNEAVVKQLAADIASFIELYAEQILGGNINATVGFTTDGKLVVGDPAGARIQITRAGGIEVYTLLANGEARLGTVLSAGEVSLAVMGEDGSKLGGIDPLGNVLGQRGAFARSLSVGGVDLLGQRARGFASTADPGILDLYPRGLVAPPSRRAEVKRVGSGSEGTYLQQRVMLRAGRRYELYALVNATTGASTGALRLRLRKTTGDTVPTTSSDLIRQITNPQSGTTNYGTDVLGSEFFTVPTDGVIRVAGMLAAIGAYADINYGTLHVKDCGPISGADVDTIGEGPGLTTYQTTWKATASRMYDRTGATNPGRDGKIEPFYVVWGGTDIRNSAAVLFGGGASSSTDISEINKPIGQALTGATIKDVTIYLHNSVWAGDGWTQPEGSLTIGPLGAASLPTTLLPEGDKWIQSIPAGQGVRVPVAPTWFGNGNLGITIGDKDFRALNDAGVLTALDSGVFHGPGSQYAPEVTITYAR